MADVSVNGWIAEGGHTIIEGKRIYQGYIIIMYARAGIGTTGSTLMPKLVGSDSWPHEKLLDLI